MVSQSSDNGPQFVSDEFAMFLKQNGVKHIRCAPYHPSSNGLVEWFVQTFKTAMKVNGANSSNLSQRLNSFLLSYRNTLHTTTNEAPSTLFFGWKLRSLLDLLRPRVDKTVFDHQGQQKRDHDAGARFRECLVGEQVLAYDTRNRTWKGVIAERTGPTSYVVQMQGGEVLWKSHIDHIKPLPFASPSSLPVIPLQVTQHGGPSPYLPCVTDVPPVKLTNPEGTVPPDYTRSTRRLHTSTPNSAKSASQLVVNNPNTPSRGEDQAQIPPVPSSMDSPTLPQVPQQVTTEASTPQRHYPARNRPPPNRF